jgi:hypothetical protein
VQDLLNKSSLAEISQQIWLHDLKLPRLCRLPKTYKEWGPIRPIVSTIGTCTYCLPDSCKLAWVLLGLQLCMSSSELSYTWCAVSRPEPKVSWSVLIWSHSSPACWNIIEQTNSIAVSFLLFLMTIFFIKDFEEMTLNRAMYKPLCCF